MTLHVFKLIVFLFVALFVQLELPAQGTKDDYERASRIEGEYRQALGGEQPSLEWLGDNLVIVEKSNGKQLIRTVDIETGKIEPASDSKVLDGGGPLLVPLAGWKRSSGGKIRSDMTLENTFENPVRVFWVQQNGGLRSYDTIEPGQQRTISTFAGHYWVIDFKADDLAAVFEATAIKCRGIINEQSQKIASQKALPNKADKRTQVKLSVRDDNIWLRNASGEDRQLTTDGSENDRYESRFHYSPDGRYAMAFRSTKIETRQVSLVESSPNDQVQPKLRRIKYAKPGDEITQRRPTLFDLENARQIPVDENPFLDSWSVDFRHWSADSERAYVLYNRRGHQKVTLRSIDSKTGDIKDIVDETSDTFVDYSSKTMLRWLGNQQIVWASERDGWNHLYRINAVTGEVVNQITQGLWVVRDIELIDQENQVIWFTAMGIHPEQDPYHRHLVKVNFDGSGLVAVTESDGNHRWKFNRERTHIVARWSRVDHPETWELRTTDGKLVRQLWQQDTSRLKEQGYEPPIRFAAPGRDGQTMIYGHLIKPSSFDPQRRYPVIEDIYAGPHNHHVSKRFGLQLRQRNLAELGFIVVQIDGMGTNWRSKKFHDVCWQNLMDGGFPDRIAWMKAAAEKYTWMDLTRVGIFGGSAGGQSALAAMLRHPDFYHAAVSDCGCHDNRMDKIWWNEAWMGKVGPHYAENSNVTHAGKLQGDLLLTVGELDNNVDPASTMQVVDALIKADKDFDFIIVPGAGHGIGESSYLKRRRQDFFVRSLLGVEPRR